jgi:acetylglutamate kinase
VTACRVVLKVGGELLEHPHDVERIASTIAALAAKAPLVVVHGGGREIDAALSSAGIPKHQVDGMRVTDAATLSVVVSVLAGAINTRLVAAVGAAGARPVGLTGADAGVVRVRQASPLLTAAGERVSLGFVGRPVSNGTPQLLTDLLGRGYLPIVACIGATTTGQLMNVNADTLAAHLSAELSARRLIVAGNTPGVLDDAGRTIRRLRGRDAARLVRSGTTTAGMIAKLQACRAALQRGVDEVFVVNGRDLDIAALAGIRGRATPKGCTQVVA